MNEPLEVLDIAPDRVAARARLLYEESRQRVFKQTDRTFAWLMMGQWVLAIVIALVVSPYVWSGNKRSLHIHVPVAIVLGAIINSLPVLLAIKRPGRLSTRATIAVAQMLWSAVLIHLTGGRIETHFHVFGSLAFLAFYRDWRVLGPATIVVAADHFLRGLYWPESVYGIANPQWWRFLEHASWVVFCDIGLTLSCRHSVHEMEEIASQRAKEESLSETLEARVRERTRELATANEELERSQGRLLQAGKMTAVGQLAAGVAHEINNPLAVILGFAQGMERRVPDGDPLRLPVTSIVRETVRCKALVRELLTFSRIGKKSTETVDLNALVKASVTLLATRARTQGVEIVEELGDLPLLLEANQIQLQQIIVNLGANAMDAMKSGGRLTLHTHANGQDDVVLEIIDTGEGIPEDIRARIFEPFFTTKDVGKGTGLGLSLAHEIVQQHRGSIDVQSDVGRGTTMTVRLPARSEGAAAP